MTDALRGWVVWWAAGLGLWLALTYSVRPAELATGAVVAAGAATAAMLVRARRQVVPRFRPVWALRAARAYMRLLTDLPMLVAVVWRRGVVRAPERGAVVSTPTDAVDPDDPVQAGDRVAIQYVGSLAPSSVVVDVDVERGLVLEHRLRP